MKTFKKIGLVGAVAFALFAFNACGDDSNSTSASGENSTQSSAVEDDESSSSINGDTSSVTPGSSSSVILSDSEGSSSSVKGSDTADGASSSSVIPDPDRESSSSSEKSSSSSAKSSSSVSSSSSVKSSSSSSAKSSSSVASSSSEYVPFDRTEPFDGTHWRNGDYVKFVDGRNNREYYYIQISGKDTAGRKATIKVMAENLNIGEMVRGRKNQEDDEKIERYCYNNDTTNCDRYGGLYQWAEMMQLPSECNTKSCADQIKANHQGICPKDWRLLTYNDFYIVVHADGNTHGVEGIRSAYGFGGYNTTGYSLVGAGYNWDNTFVNLNEGTYWHYPEENPENFALWSKGSWQDRTSKSNPISNTPKKQGFSVRCVMVE